MSTHEEINKAIAAHGQWKQKLRTAIDSGECESTPGRVKQDNNCSFGKWLYERIDPEIKGSTFYHTIVKLHAEFHQEAGNILDEALNGDKNIASSQIGLGSQFAKLSAKLTHEMKEWQDSLS